MSNFNNRTLNRISRSTDSGDSHRKQSIMKIKDNTKSWPKVGTILPGEVYENTASGAKFIGVLCAGGVRGLVNLADGTSYAKSEIDLSYLRARPDALLTFTEED
jgi:hypothetical protein